MDGKLLADAAVAEAALPVLRTDGALILVTAASAGAGDALHGGAGWSEDLASVIGYLIDNFSTSALTTYVRRF